MMTFEEFEDIALDAYDALPDEIKKNLNLGLAVVPDLKMGREGLTFIMGEYFTSPMLGRGVRLFYGSFMSVMGDAPHAMIHQEIINTVKHELLHHVEISAGVDHLGDEDRAKMKKIRRRFGIIPSDKEIIKKIWNRLLTAGLVLIAMLLIVYFLVIRHL
jgi:predicted Zn-dependent protease with MMP-like domain